MNPETRNLVAAICLSMAVLVGYQMLFGKAPEDQTKNDTGASKVAEINNEPSIDLPKEETEDIFVEKKKKNFKKIPRVKILNNELILS